jgi:Transposase DDE domain group 1
MTTECNQFVFGFHPRKRREIRAQFDGGAITSDGGGLLLREVEKRIGVLRQFAACFTDYRNPELIEHTVEELVAQRVYGLASGHEDLNDHEELRNDPLLAVLVEKADPGSQALAGKSTLNRLELTKETASRKERYKKIVLDHGAVDRLLVEVFLEAYREEPQEIILDLDATDDPLAIRAAGGAFLPWLLWTLLLSAVVHLLRRVLAVCAVAIIEYRCLSGKCRGAEEHRGTGSFRVAPGAFRSAGRFGILPRGADGLV